MEQQEQREQQALLHFLKSENTIIFSGKPYSFKEEEWDAVKDDLPKFWHQENDVLLLFSYYNDGSYFCEREKTVYDYKFKTYIKRAYSFCEPSEEDAKNLYEKFVILIENIRLRQLQEAKDEVKQIVLKEGKMMLGSLITYRNDLLKRSDFSQFPDVPMEEKTREMWKNHRQYLRDMTLSDEWILGDFRYINFPLSPYEYEALPLDKQVEYLTIPEHFDNYGQKILKLRLAKVLQYISSPILVSDSDQPLFFSTEELKSLNTLPYEEYLDKVNKYLARIDENLKFEVVIVDKGCASE